MEKQFNHAAGNLTSKVDLSKVGGSMLYQYSQNERNLLNFNNILLFVSGYIRILMGSQNIEHSIPTEIQVLICELFMIYQLIEHNVQLMEKLIFKYKIIDNIGTSPTFDYYNQFATLLSAPIYNWYFKQKIFKTLFTNSMNNHNNINVNKHSKNKNENKNENEFFDNMCNHMYCDALNDNSIYPNEKYREIPHKLFCNFIKYCNKSIEQESESQLESKKEEKKKESSKGFECNIIDTPNKFGKIYSLSNSDDCVVVCDVDIPLYTLQFVYFISKLDYLHRNSKNTNIYNSNVNIKKEIRPKYASFMFIKGKANQWKPIYHESSQQFYYYNEKTGETSWIKPEEHEEEDNWRVYKTLENKKKQVKLRLVNVKNGESSMIQDIVINQETCLTDEMIQVVKEKKIWSFTSKKNRWIAQLDIVGKRYFFENQVNGMVQYEIPQVLFK